VPIGWVQSALRVLDDAPNQREGAPRAWIRFDQQAVEGAKDLRPGDEILVLTWLHLSRRDELSTHPEDDASQQLTGVFSTCSPNRPAIDGTRVWTSSRPSTRPHDAQHAAVLPGDLSAHEP
jgi:tRNA (Thr-GGU) A37 N-methylase